MEIFKIQLPLAAGGVPIENSPAYCYNEGKKNTLMLDIDDDLLAFMGGEPKKFANCDRGPEDQLIIVSEAEWQEW